MLSCKEVTKLVSENLDRDLPLLRRLGLRLHVMMCKGCSAYRRQIESLNKLVADRYRRNPPEKAGRSISTDAAERIKASLRSDTSRPA